MRIQALFAIMVLVAGCHLSGLKDLSLDSVPVRKEPPLPPQSSQISLTPVTAQSVTPSLLPPTAQPLLLPPDATHVASPSLQDVPLAPAVPTELAPILSTPIALPPRSVTAEMGYLKVVMTDAPADFGKIFFDITDMKLLNHQQVEPLPIEKSKFPLELFSLKDRPVILVEKELKPSQWTALYLKIVALHAQDRSGRSADLNLVPEALSGLTLPYRLAIRPGVMTLVILDFDARRSLIIRNGRDVLKPEMGLFVSETPIGGQSAPSPTSSNASASPTPDPTRTPLIESCRDTKSQGALGVCVSATPTPSASAATSETAATPTPEPTRTPLLDRLR